jgi:hypothetical protein
MENLINILEEFEKRIEPIVGNNNLDEIKHNLKYYTNEIKIDFIIKNKNIRLLDNFDNDRIRYRILEEYDFKDDEFKYFLSMIGEYNYSFFSCLRMNKKYSAEIFKYLLGTESFLSLYFKNGGRDILEDNIIKYDKESIFQVYNLLREGEVKNYFISQVITHKRFEKNMADYLFEKNLVSLNYKFYDPRNGCDTTHFMFLFRASPNLNTLKKCFDLGGDLNIFQENAKICNLFENICNKYSDVLGKENYNQIVRYCLMRGSNPNHCAFWSYCNSKKIEYKTILLFFEKGGDLNWNRDKYSTVLSILISNKSFNFTNDFLSLCLKKRGDLNITLRNSKSPFSIMKSPLLEHAYYKGGKLTCGDGDYPVRLVCLHKFREVGNIKEKYLREKEKYIYLYLNIILKKRICYLNTY